jgi:hypothetical protein
MSERPFLVLIGTILIVGLVLVGCEKSPAKALQGTWEAESGPGMVEWQFRGNDYSEKIFLGDTLVAEVSGQFSIAGDRLTFSSTDADNSDVSLLYTLEGNTLTFIGFDDDPRVAIPLIYQKKGAKP